MNLSEEKLFMNKPFFVDRAGYVFQPTIDEIMNIGSINYFNLVSPYLMELKDTNESVYNLFFKQENLSSINYISMSLELFFKQEVKVDSFNKRFLIGEHGVIDKDNFSELSEIIKLISCFEEDVPEKLPENMSEEQKRIHEKMKYHRNRRANIDAPTLKEILNTVIHRGRSFIPYDVVGKFNYYQLINSYKAIFGLDSHDISMMYKLSPNFEVKDDIPHWSKVLKQI